MRWNVAPSSEEIALLMEAGFIYRDARKFQEARDVFDGVRALLPNSEAPEVALGTVAFQEGDFAGAERHYQRAIEMNPSSAYAYAHLGELRLFEKDKEAARRHLKQAMDLDHPRGEFRKMAASLIELTETVRFSE